jgi:hypothetical protein
MCVHSDKRTKQDTKFQRYKGSFMVFEGTNKDDNNIVWINA